MARITINKYGIAELNKVASRTTGEIEAQTLLLESIPQLENGMIVFIDPAQDRLVLELADGCVQAKYLHFSNARRYNEHEQAQNNFVFTNSAYQAPRAYKLTAGDIFHTNVVDADIAYEGFAEVVNGVITSAATGDLFIKPATMQDDTPGFVVRVIE